jgi:hypothetical protein
MTARLADFDQHYTAFATRYEQDQDPIGALKAYEDELKSRGLGKREIRTRRRQDAHLRTLRANAALVLRRRRLRQELYRDLDIEQIEGEAQKLLQERLQRVSILAAAPVEDFTAFTLKLEILFREIFQYDPQHGPLVAELVADVRRLNKVGAQP